MNVQETAIAASRMIPGTSIQSDIEVSDALLNILTAHIIEDSG